MTSTQRTLVYPSFYLLTSGAALVLAPDFTLGVLFSNGHYGDVMPRMAGAAILALGILVLQIFRHDVAALYPTLVGVRVMLCTVWMGLFLYTRDPFFLAVFGVVAVGMAWTALSLWRARRRGAATS